MCDFLFRPCGSTEHYKGINVDNENGDKSSVSNHSSAMSSSSAQDPPAPGTPKEEEPHPQEGSSKEAPSAPAPKLTVAQRMAERRAKLKELNRRRNEARQLNHAEVVDEDRRNKEPKNMEAR